MTSTSEAGYVKNIAHFKSLIEILTKLGTAYNPSQPELQVANLEALLNDARAKIQDTETANIAYFNAVHLRQLAFADIRPLSSRLVNIIANTGAAPQTLNAAKALSRKMYGRRASTAPPKPIDPNAEAPKTISTSQQSFDQLIQHLSGIVGIIRTIPSYNPNEPELQLATLEAQLVDLTRCNDDVATTYAGISIARMERNKILFDKENSIHANAMAVKRYIKAIYKPKSHVYVEVGSIRFASMKNI